MEPMTPTALRKLRVVDLKEKLSNLGLPLNGLKADLIKRLSDYYSSQAATFNVVQQQLPPPQALPSVQPTIGQPGLVHGSPNYYINQHQHQQHQLQLGAHIQHSSPSPSISIQPCFAPPHITHEDLPTNFSSQVNQLSSPIELSTHHQPYQSHPSLQSHQSHQAHQSLQTHQTHQPLQSHQPHQAHQVHQAHHYHEPPSHMHTSPSVIESSHIKMPSDDSTHYFDNQRRSNHSMNQPLQSPSSIDLSSHMSFIQDKPTTRDCQPMPTNQSQDSVSVDTSPMKQSDSPAVSMDQPQDHMIHEDPEDNQVHETPQKAIFDLENLLNEALKANQPIDLSAADSYKEDENITEQTSQNEDSCSNVTDLSQKHEPSHVPESSSSTVDYSEPEIPHKMEPEPEPEILHEPEYQPEVQPPCMQQTEPELPFQFQREMQPKPEASQELVQQTDNIIPDHCPGIVTNSSEICESASGAETQFSLDSDKVEERDFNQETNSEYSQKASTFTYADQDQLLESIDDNQTQAGDQVSDLDNKLEENDKMETSFVREESSADVLSKVNQQTFSSSIELGADAQHSELISVKVSDTCVDLETKSESSEPNINQNINSDQIQSDLTSESNEQPTSVVNDEFTEIQALEEKAEKKDLSEMNVSMVDDPPDTPVIPVHDAEKLQKSDEPKQKLSKNAKKKLRKKKKKAEKAKAPSIKENGKSVDLDEDDDIEIEYVEDEVAHDPIYFQYVRVFEKFKGNDTKHMESNEDENDIVDPVKKMLERKKPVELELKEEDEKNDGEPKLSKRKLKQLTRMTVADLKQKVSHPELVEMHDVTAKDPLLLLHLKSTRNSVPVPRHWCFKRKYLQGKRGFEKPPFKLPEFIRKTGIMEMRQALQEKEDAKSLKTKQREKIRPKLGKIDIDYQKLHDAFFKWQTKPKMTIHGDIYYEGKEFETRLKEKKPGDLSVDLRVALGMPTGPNAHKCPPPWLIAMQRYGPPPSYPNLKIPGLNARIPDGCTFGYHAGGWGKPPVDEYGRPLYGDVFGLSSAQDSTNAEEDVDQSLWGEMESEEEEEEEEEEDDETTNNNDRPSGREAEESGIATPSEGLATPSGFASIPNGMETPDIIELRKRKIEAEMESNENPALYTIIPEKKSDGIGKEMMGSTHVYDVSGSILKKGQGIEVALNPDDLELPVAGLTAKYEQTLKEQQAHLAKEDLSDMVAEHAARQKRKKTQDTSKSNKKYKDFKF